MERRFDAIFAAALIGAICPQTTVGSQEFSKLVSEGKGLELKGLVSVKDGGSLLLGSARFPDRMRDACVVKLDSSGNCLWATSVGSPADDVPYAFIETADGEGGWLYRSLGIQPGNGSGGRRRPRESRDVSPGLEGQDPLVQGSRMAAVRRLRADGGVRKRYASAAPGQSGNAHIPGSRRLPLLRLAD